MQGKRPNWKAAYEQFIEENLESPSEFFENIALYLEELYASGSPYIKDSKLLYANISNGSWARFHKDSERIRRLESGTNKWIFELLSDEGSESPIVGVSAALSGPGEAWIEMEVSVEFHLF